MLGPRERIRVMNPHGPGRALVTGATGYIGARLVAALLDKGWTVRVLTRDAAKIGPRAWADRVEVVEGDAEQRADLDRACEGVDVGYYLLHSMDGVGDFAERDRVLARSFGEAMAAAGAGRIVYLSGLHPDDETLSKHLASRVEVGDILLASGVPTAVLQAAVIVGSGSASFEMLRHLTHRLPVMVAPKWLDNRIQPVAIRDVLHYLTAVATLPADVNRTFDLGGPDVLTYRQMIERFAAHSGLRERIVFTVPVLTPRLASHWVGFVTPVPRGIARPLVGSLVNEVVCKERDLDAAVPAPAGGMLDFDEAVQAALSQTVAEKASRPEPGTANPAHLAASDPAWAG